MAWNGATKQVLCDLRTGLLENHGLEHAWARIGLLPYFVGRVHACWWKTCLDEWVATMLHAAPMVPKVQYQ